MTLVYRVEELLALRDSTSEPAVSIEKFTDKEVIKGEKRLLIHSKFTSHAMPVQPNSALTGLPAYSHLSISLFI